jgi:hypothetical protein
MYVYIYIYIYTDVYVCMYVYDHIGYTKAQAINESRGISQGAVKVGDKIIAFATEIDRRLALSATSARIVVTGILHMEDMYLYIQCQSDDLLL